MDNFLEQLNSSEGKLLFTSVTEKIIELQNLGELTNEQKFEVVVEFCYSLIEKIDDEVSNVPLIGWFLRLLVDNPISDSLEKEACKLFVQTVFRSIKPLL
jgi:hypothetical protein